MTRRMKLKKETVSRKTGSRFFRMYFGSNQVDELPQSHCGHNREGRLFSWLHIYYAHLAFVRFEHSMCRGSLMTPRQSIVRMILWYYDVRGDLQFDFYSNFCVKK